MLVVIVLQLLLPDRLAIGPTWLLPSAEGALALALLIANPVRLERDSVLIRRLSLVLVALISFANGMSVLFLIHSLVTGGRHQTAAALLISGGQIYVTNIVAFALWYWELDRGGPLARAAGERDTPSFLFAQMTAPDVAAPGWRPTFVDYLYLSFTNATAFSPTDTLPLARWAKLLMLVQSAFALVTVALVIARAVNVL
jgi:hypothetical protein